MIRRLSRVCRTLHIYLTLLALGAILFFAVTGFMMNHEEWFTRSALAVHEQKRTLEPAFLAKADRLAIVERLRKDFGIRQNMTDYELDGPSLRIVFKGPGRTTEAEIDRDSGGVLVRSESRGLMGLLGDLHKGSQTGRTWRWVLDAVSILLALGAISGLVLWMSLPRRRLAGIVALLAGVGAAIGLVLTAV